MLLLVFLFLLLLLFILLKKELRGVRGEKRKGMGFEGVTKGLCRKPNGFLHPGRIT